MLVDPESIKNTVKSSVFFTLLGSTSVKAVHRTLMKLSSGHWFPTFLGLCLVGPLLSNEDI